MDIEAAKSKLQRIIELARLRREGIEPQPQPVAPKPMSEATPEAVTSSPREAAEATPKSVEPEPEPDFTDGTWIEVREPELVTLIEHYDQPNEVRREVLSGRFISSWRKRTPMDGDAPFVLLIPKSRHKPTEEKVEFAKWGEPGPKVDPRFVAKYGRKERVWNHWSLGRNSGRMNWRGEIEE